MPEGTPVKLCGNAGRELLLNIKEQKFANEIEKYRSVLKFFTVRRKHFN